MSAQILDGRATANSIRERIREESEELARSKTPPGLAVVLVGDDPASATYVRSKERACRKVGIQGFQHRLPADTGESEVLQLVRKLNRDPAVHGILVQLPLPGHIDADVVTHAIDPDKDVDGLHPVNLGRLVADQPGFVPCTPLGIVTLLQEYGISTAGQHVVVVGRSLLVGKTLANLMLTRGSRGNATVTVCHSRTPDLTKHTRQADILVAAIGAVGMIDGEMVRDGAVVIDVGINRVDDPEAKRGYRLVGDVEFDSVNPKAKAITPVPGGVGPMTVAMLLQNTICAARQASTRW